MLKQQLTGHSRHLSMRFCVLEDAGTATEDDEDKSLVCKLSPGVMSFIDDSMGDGNTGWSSFSTPGDIVGAGSAGGDGEGASLWLRRFGIGVAAAMGDIGFRFGGLPRLAPGRKCVQRIGYKNQILTRWFR